MALLIIIINILLILISCVVQQQKMLAMSDEERAKYIKNGYQTDRQKKVGQYISIVFWTIIGAIVFGFGFYHLLCMF